MLLTAICRPTKQTLRIMHLMGILLLAFGLSLSATTSSQTITYSGKQVALEQVFAAIRQQTGYSVVFNRQQTQRSRISVEATGVLLEDFLSMILSAVPFQFQIEGKTIFIRKKDDLSNEQDHSVSVFDLPPIIIRGRIVNEKGEPVVASVIIKGTKRGTTTNANGEFELANVDNNAVLIVSGTNIEEREFRLVENPRLKSGDMITITAKNRIEESEVVTISTGYYSTTKAKSTMNIEKVPGKQIQDQPVTNIMNALAGRVAGLEVTPFTGAAGVGPAIRIRGNNSFRGDGSFPLYVIDGVQLESSPISSQNNVFGSNFDPLGAINPADIESVEVLKDAAATAIYGSRGANGVIRITTKKSSKGSGTKVELNVYKGAGVVPKKLDMLSREQFIAMRKEKYANDGEEIPDYAADISGKFWDTTRSTDWQQVLLGGTSNIHDVQIGLSGGNSQTSFRLNGGVHKETVSYDGDFGYRRATLNLNLNHISANQRFTMTIVALFGNEKNKLFNNDNFLSQSLVLAPTAPALYDSAGGLNWQQAEIFPDFFFHTWNNPLAFLEEKLDYQSSHLNSNTLFSYQLAKGLFAKVNLSYAELHSNENTRKPISGSAPALRVGLTGVSQFTTNQRKTYSVEPQLNYVRESNRHHWNAILGGSYRYSLIQNEALIAEGYQSDELLETMQAAPILRAVRDNVQEYKFNSGFARLAYDFADKYLIDLSGRRDGSSRFGPGKKFGNFGAIGMGWIFSKESFLINSNWLSTGKIRASYGITGSDQIGDYRYYNTYSIAPAMYQNTIGLVPTALFNPDYAWEKTRKTEVALELGFFRDRLFIQTSLYRNLTFNQLINFVLPYTTGFDGVTQNFDATIENKGMELLINSQNIIGRNFRWTTSFNFSLPKNRLIKFDGIKSSPYASIYQVGQSINDRLNVYTYKGVDPLTGNYLLEDTNGDDQITQDDMKTVTQQEQTAFGGMVNSFTYQGIQVDFLLQFSKGRRGSWMPRSPVGSSGVNYPAYILDHWQKPGDITEWGRFSSEIDSDYYLVLGSDRNITDASFIRLKTVSISYQLPFAFIRRARLSEMRLYVQGQNLLTWTKYPGLDPETGNGLPPLRMLTAGVQIKL